MKSLIAPFALVLFLFAAGPPPRTEPPPVPPPDFPISTSRFDPAGFIDADRVVKRARKIAISKLGTRRCEIAFGMAFPSLGTDTDLAKMFETQVFILAVDEMPFEDEAEDYLGFVHCGVSWNTFLIHRTLAAWSGAKEAAKTMIHEFAHLIDCPNIVATWLSEESMTAEDAARRQRVADDIAATCMGGK